MAMVDAAAALDAPVILQASVKTVKYRGHAACAGWIKELAADTSVPTSLHLDHCLDLDVIRGCIDHGWTDAMVDASALPFDENLAISLEVVTMAAAAGMGVEAELGRIVGVEDDIFVDARDAHLTEVEEAVRFASTWTWRCSRRPSARRTATTRVNRTLHLTGLRKFIGARASRWPCMEAPGWPTTFSRNRSPVAVPRSIFRHSSNTP